MYLLIRLRFLLRHAWVTFADVGYTVLSPLVLSLPKFLIIWLFDLSILSVPDKGYTRKVPCALNWISTFLFVNIKYRLPDVQ